jgi:hypothetical protein
MSDEPKRPVRLRSAATDKRKALEHYQDLRRSGKSKRAVVISEAEDGAITILGQMLKPSEIAGLLLIAAEAVAHIETEQRKPKLEPHHEVISVGEHSQGTIPKRGITLDAEGIMVPPEGENIISCGQCHHPRWLILFNNADETPSRYACAHCGNEVVVHRIVHDEGRA